MIGSCQREANWQGCVWRGPQRGFALALNPHALSDAAGQGYLLADPQAATSAVNPAFTFPLSARLRRLPHACSKVIPSLASLHWPRMQHLLDSELHMFACPFPHGRGAVMVG